MKKIIDRNGRLFGFISVIDLLVIVVVAVMGFALYTKNTQMAITSTNTADQTITYQILASGIRTYVAEAVREGDQLFDPDRSSGGTLGTITDIQLMPGTKPFDVKALTVGGAFPHRLGLSETVLVFEHHLTFYGGLEKFIADVPQLKAKVCEKKLFVESSTEDAVRLVEAGVDGVQLDKVAPEQVAQLVPQLKAINPHVTLIAAGGVNLGNAAEYAATGVDGLATTCLHFAKPLDMSVRMSAL